MIVTVLGAGSMGLALQPIGSIVFGELGSDPRSIGSLSWAFASIAVALAYPLGRVSNKQIEWSIVGAIGIAISPHVYYLWQALDTVSVPAGAVVEMAGSINTSLQPLAETSVIAAICLWAAIPLYHLGRTQSDIGTSSRVPSLPTATLGLGICLLQVLSIGAANPVRAGSLQGVVLLFLVSPVLYFSGRLLQGIHTLNSDPENGAETGAD
ncbi:MULTISPECIES: hypothetical protein [Halomicrobium]|uniref:Uncharacterized protein n=1 Tax=Halomicrobium mukohataei TaxID=57705 RepID=A0A4D6KB10_9EURY|nr:MULTISPECIES: hypothetical protein [Halomicrobium]QCD65064.1 hypothetical protein E5139_05200 [Halomicrobium mukohataei]QFR19870.1 hypothetical protein GBQ70_05195 [Halomicrobium sp. ZPS1]